MGVGTEVRRLEKILVVVSVLFVGCQGQGQSQSPSVATPPTQSPATASRAAPRSPGNFQQEAVAARSAAYSREYPWGDDTGTARVKGVLSWAGSDPPAPVWRPALTLRGLRDTPSARLFYRVRTNERGEFSFDRIKGGHFTLSDRDGNEIHWRLKVEITEGEEKTIDLSPGNRIEIHDDFPEEHKALPSAVPR